VHRERQTVRPQIWHGANCYNGLGRRTSTSIVSFWWINTYFFLPVGLECLAHAAASSPYFHFFFFFIIIFVAVPGDAPSLQGPQSAMQTGPMQHEVGLHRSLAPQSLDAVQFLPQVA
jgi:uncharacterized membrane protein YkgB